MCLKIRGAVRVFALVHLLAASVAFGQYQIVGTAISDRPGNVTRTEITVQDGTNPVNQFKSDRLD